MVAPDPEPFSCNCGDSECQDCFPIYSILLRTRTEIEIAWLAGILEGEGCFIWTNVNHGYYGNLSVRLKMTDKDIIERVHALIGCRNNQISERHSHKAGYKSLFLIQYAGTPAAEIMSAIFPYMGQRRQEKIHSLLTRWEKRPGKRMAQAGEKCHFAKLSMNDVIQIRCLAVDHTAKQVAIQFGVTVSTIKNIWSYKSWN